MTVLREWRAEIRRADRDRYRDYIRDTGLADYRATPGNISAAIAFRDLDADRCEVVTLSVWTSMDAIIGFAGTPVDQARYYPDDDGFLLTRPDKVQHYDLTGLGPAFVAAEQER